MSGGSRRGGTRGPAAEADAPPAGWTVGATGAGSPKWTVEAEASAPAGGNVLRPSGAGTFPSVVREDGALTDGSVEVRFEPLAGRQDAAGGVVRRWMDGDNCYARANAIEDNVALCDTANGRRHTIGSVDASVAISVWPALEIDFAGTRVRVAPDGNVCIDVGDPHVAGPGAVGGWTETGSVTAFAAFRFDGER